MVRQTMRPLLALVLLLLLALPATAAAGDASLERSWSRYLDAGQRLEEAFEDLDFDNPRDFARAFRRGLRVVRGAQRRIAADTPTTLTGGAAQEAALASFERSTFALKRLIRSFTLIEKAVRLKKQGRRNEARAVGERLEALLEPVDSATRKSLRLERQAKKLFRAIARA